MRRSLMVAMAAVALVCGSVRLLAQTPQAPQPEDKYLWLEDVYSPRSLAWVKAHDEQTAKVLENDPRYAAFQAEALQIAENPNRLPVPALVKDTVYNLWKDAQNPHGLLRRTSIASYRSEHPQWQTVLDYDALGRAEKVSWVPHGLDCLYPAQNDCMVTLSAGGEDASTEREFNLQTASFIPNGFELPRSKQDVAWLDHDTLLVARDWGAGTMTTSGYPFVVKEWRRGTPLSEAKEVFRGQVPLLDMLRYEHIAAGASWVGEYGSVSVPTERAFLASISPYQQLKPGVKYPTPFIFTTTKDDRVGPQHARKFAAKMEEFHDPFYYYEIVEGGHGAGADLKEEAGTWAMTYVYLARELMDEPTTASSADATATHSR